MLSRGNDTVTRGRKIKGQGCRATVLRTKVEVVHAVRHEDIVESRQTRIIIAFEILVSAISSVDILL